MASKINGAVHVRTLRFTKYETDIYFNKKAETFFAVVPPDERLDAKSVDELALAVRKHHDAYVVPGKWVRKIYVVVTGSRGEDGGGLLYGRQDYSTSQNLNVTFTLFEERDGGCPPGTRMARAWDPDPDERFANDRSRIYGQDITHNLERGPDDEGIAVILEWSQGAEDTLREVQKAMAQLQGRLADLVKSPELASGNIQKLLAG